MKKLELYPVEVYEFQSDHKWTWIEEIQKLKLKENSTGVLNTFPVLHKDPTFKPILDFIHESLNKIQLHRNFDCDGFKVSSMWANFYPPGASQHAHRHANSYWSGVLYLSGGAPTIFYDPVEKRSHGEWDIFTLPKTSVEGFDQNNTIKIEKIEAEAGKLIIFPSWFVHDTAFSKEDRYSISFNALPYGKINSNFMGGEGLKIDVL